MNENNEKVTTTEQTIKDFLHKMSTQDNRGTAIPIFYVIRTSTWVPVMEEYQFGEDKKTVYVNSESGEYTEISEKEYMDMVDGEEDEFGYTKEDYVELVVGRVWEERGMFLTEDDAEHHLKLNSYHYSSDAHTYVKHAWRAPELEEFLSALFSHFGVEVPR